MTETISVEQTVAERRVAGTVGIGVAVGLAVILGIHPPGDTALYDDPIEFVDHVGTYWISLHLVAALLFLGVPTVVGAWGGTLESPVARIFGRMAGTMSVIGVAIAALHLVGTDAITFELKSWLSTSKTTLNRSCGELVGNRRRTSSRWHIIPTRSPRGYSLAHASRVYFLHHAQIIGRFLTL